MTWLLSHGKYKCVLSHPIPSHGNPMGIPFPWTSLLIRNVQYQKIGLIAYRCEASNLAGLEYIQLNKEVFLFTLFRPVKLYMCDRSNQVYTECFKALKCLT